MILIKEHDIVGTGGTWETCARVIKCPQLLIEIVSHSLYVRCPADNFLVDQV